MKASMYIGVLEGHRHIFMDGLELCFRVLLPLCIHHSGPDTSGMTCFEAWNYEAAADIANKKRRLMADEKDLAKAVNGHFTHAVL
jgi:hypothetical protein